MSEIEARFAEAREAVLRGSAELAAAMGLPAPRIYDARPTNALLPYVGAWEDQFIDDSDECQDGTEIFSTTHIWSREEAPGSGQARRIAGIVRALLNADLGIVGHETVLYAFEDMRVLTDPDGATHVVLVHRYLTTPSAA